MISLILPYWKRQEATNASLRALAGLYNDDFLEVVVVDDGDPLPFGRPLLPRNLKVVKLPWHVEPRSPASAWNAGVRASRGELIALSMPEVWHAGPILYEMEKELERLGPDGYVLAAAWCPEQNRWHCHSSIAVPDCPPGTGLAFLGLMRRALWERAGGFDEDYMAGVGYEDRDFLMRMVHAGAKFKLRDDLVAIHPKTGAQVKWPAAGMAVNEAIFRRKWCLPSPA